jgi:hypothetical protein
VCVMDSFWMELKVFVYVFCDASMKLGDFVMDFFDFLMSLVVPSLA